MGRWTCTLSFAKAARSFWIDRAFYIICELICHLGSIRYDCIGQDLHFLLLGIVSDESSIRWAMMNVARCADFCIIASLCRSFVRPNQDTCAWTVVRCVRDRSWRSWISWLCRYLTMIVDVQYLEQYLSMYISWVAFNEIISRNNRYRYVWSMNICILLFKYKKSYLLLLKIFIYTSD